LKHVFVRPAPPKENKSTTTVTIEWKSTHQSINGVLMGLGRKSECHAGNNKMRSPLEEHLGTYSPPEKGSRRCAVMSVIDGVAK
jgi:hypothetical protein